MTISGGPGLGGKLGIDATRKIGAETTRSWGERLAMDKATCQRIDGLAQTLTDLFVRNEKPARQQA